MINNISEYPGILLIKHNNKCQIYKAVNLKKKINKIISKLGAVDYTILDVIETKDFTKALKQLDKLEKKYTLENIQPKNEESNIILFYFKNPNNGFRKVSIYEDIPEGYVKITKEEYER